MTDRQGLLEKQSAAFADNGKTHSSAPKGHMDMGCSVVAIAKRHEGDRLLEKTLSNINITEPLTKREAEILKLIVSSKTNKEIAKVLCRTQRTIEYHRNRLMRKLNAHNVADLIKRAISMGIT